MSASVRRPVLFWLGVATGLLLLGATPFAAHVLLRHEGGKVFGFGIRETPDGAARVAWVNPRGPAAGKLVPGDRVVAIAGDSRVTPWLSSHLLELAPGDRYEVRVEREGTATDVPLEVGAAPQQEPGPVRLRHLVLALGFTLTGLFILLARPGNVRGRLVVLAAYATGGGFLFGTSTFVLPPGLELAVVNTLRAPMALGVAIVFHTYSRLFAEVPETGLLRAVRWLLYGWGAALSLAWGVELTLQVLGSGAAVAFLDAHRRLFAALVAVRSTLLPFLLLAFVAIAAVLIRAYRALSAPNERRRIQWLVFGALAGLLPFLLQALLRATGTARLAAAEPLIRLLDLAAPFVGLVVPATFLYAVVKHQVLDIRVVVRRGVQYLLARWSLTLALLTPAALLGVELFSSRDLTLRQLLFGRPFTLVLLGAAALGLGFREPLRRSVDRRFFREVVDRERLLLSLIDSLKSAGTLSQAGQLVASQLGAAFRPESLRLVLFGLSVEHSSGTSGTSMSTLDISEGSELVESLRRSGRASEAPDASGAVAVPIGGGERQLTGVLLLGPRQSEEPYSPDDRALLSAVGGQLAIVCENEVLRRRVLEEERARHGVLAHLDAGMNLLKECPACGRCYDRADERCASDGLPLRLSLPVERTLDGRYRLERLLGRGGMGAVYEAVDDRLKRVVAVKLIARNVGDDDALRRFRREAQAAARLSHPGIVSVFDYGNVGPENAYIVMERLTGSTLAAELARGEWPSRAQLADWLSQTLDAVAAAHASGVVHRDLKPENVFLTRDHEGAVHVKVLDFGLAKLELGEGSGSLTAKGNLMGTLAYMAPEQLSGGKVDARADIFSLGVLAFECLTSRHPFRGRSPVETVGAILQRDATLEGCDELDAVLRRCLAKRPEDRYTTVAEMKAALIPAVQRAPELRGGAVPVSEEDETSPVGGA